MAPGDQVDCNHVGNELDIGMLQRGRLQCLLNCRPGRIGDVNDPPVAMPSLARQMQCAAFIGEGNAEIDQPLDGLGRGLDDMLDHLPVVEPGAGDHRVVDMRFEAVPFLEHGGDATLRPARRALAQRALGDHRDLAVLGEVERSGQPGRAGADDQDVRGGAHAAFSLTRLRNTSSRSGSRVRTSTIAKPSR